MTQEDQIQSCGNSGSANGIGSNGGRSCKKPKQKKTPQRGLGVAQLEKLRVEEQQKNDEAVASPAILPSPSSSGTSSKASSYLPLPIPNFHPFNQPSSSPISLPSGSPLSLQNVDVKVSSTVIVPGHGSVPKLWNSHEYDFEKESFGVDPRLAFLSSLPHESNSNSIWPQWVQQRTQPHQQPSSSMANVSLGTSTPSLRYTMEPPSNQNYIGSCIALQPEEKMIGMKRPYPFSLDVPPSPFNFRLPTFVAPMKIHDTTSCGSGSGFNYAGNVTFREVPSSSTSNSEPNSKGSNAENYENFNGDFLTLAPPTPTSLCPPSNFKSPSTFLAFHNQEYPPLESLPCQGIIEDQITPLPGFSRFNQQQQPFYSLFPPVAKAAQIGQTTARIQSSNGEVGENVDLNLGENVDLNLKL